MPAPRGDPKGSSIRARTPSIAWKLLVVLPFVAGCSPIGNSASQSAAHSSQQAPAQAFSPKDIATFLDAAQKAEAISNSLQRCTDYPDPPRSHWSRATTTAYCRYLAQSVLSKSEAIDLIRNGYAAELDRRLAAAMKAQAAHPQLRGLLDRTYRVDFVDGSFDMREILDAWKRDLPDSAFAYAASGAAYVQMAFDARGSDFIDKTSHSQLASMERIVELAHADLDKAATLDPRITPVYRAMIYADGLDGNGAYATQAFRRAMAVDPANYSVFTAMSWRLQPRWGGSLTAMRKLAEQAQAQARNDPLLTLLWPEADAIRKRIDCNCNGVARPADIAAVLGVAASRKLLADVGNAADDNGQRAISTIYLSEALRFDPSMLDERLTRANNLVLMGRSAWGLAEADRAVAANPGNARTLRARGFNRERTKDLAGAEQDYRAAIVLDPDDAWTLNQLGSIYVHQTHAWDKGWDLADRLIQVHPDDPNGWLLRASIQKDQPRAGLHETLAYFMAHFGNDPNVRPILPKVRAELRKEAAAALAQPAQK